MSVPAPHFLLYAEAAQAAEGADCNAGRWRFVLRLPGGETSLEAADEEPAAGPERLELLAVVRGLESLAQPSRVTLLSGSRQLRRGLEFGLSQWRENDWQWERYGRMAAIKNGDLWRRLDRLLDIHTIECRPAKLEKADDLTPRPVAVGSRRLRFDRAEAAQPAKHQTPNTKHQISPPPEIRNRLSRIRRGAVREATITHGVPRTVRFRPLRFLLSILSAWRSKIGRPQEPLTQHDQEAAWHVACGKASRR
jgi:ribonuclease HI